MNGNDLAACAVIALGVGGVVVGSAGISTTTGCGLTAGRVTA